MLIWSTVVIAIIAVAVLAGRFRTWRMTHAEENAASFLANKDNIESTLKNIIITFDRSWVLRCKKNSDEFKRVLLNEIKFMPCYSDEEIWEIKKFIEMNADLLYDYALRNCKISPNETYSKRLN